MGKGKETRWDKEKQKESRAPMFGDRFCGVRRARNIEKHKREKEAEDSIGEKDTKRSSRLARPKKRSGVFSTGPF